MKNKVIAITANTSWYLFNFRKNTIKALLASGYSVVACAPKDNYSDKLIEVGCEFYPIRIDRSGKNPLKDIITIFDFYKTFRRFKVNIVLNFTPKNNIYSTFAAKMRRVKVVNNIAGLGAAFGHSGLLNSIVKKLYQCSQKKADFIFFQNRDDESIFSELGISNTRRDVLPGSGVDLDRFKVTPSIDDGVVRFVLVARMLIDKGIVEFVNSARILRAKYKNNVEFKLIGFIEVNNDRSVSSEQMQSWVEEGIVEYLGVSDNVESIVGQMDCVILPSFYREGVPKSLLEAAAMGKPIITTDNVGCRETVQDNISGFLCQPQSTESLCEKIELIISMSHSERSNMGMLGRKRIEQHFDEKIVIDKYMAVITQLLENKFEKEIR